MYNQKQFYLEKEVYYQALWMLRQYPALKAEYADLVQSSPSLDGQPRSTDPGDPTGEAAARAAVVSAKIRIIETALAKIPGEYRAGLLLNIVDREPYPAIANRSTWKAWRRRLIYFVARGAGMI